MSTSSPSQSRYLYSFSRRDNFTSSTPTGTIRPLPEFVQPDHKLFNFRSHRINHSKAFLPKSPIKSAPPISRVFPHRLWAPEKAHAVSFRDDSKLVDSAIQSRFYDSERSELYVEQCFTIEKKLGEGSFGEVMRVKSHENGKLYAIKRSREKFRNEADRRRKLDEVHKHEQLPKHPNCVEFTKAWEENQRLYIQTELCVMSLQEYIESIDIIPEERVWGILIDLLLGLSHIHKHGFIHLDIKPANIFLLDSGVCKIGDFGLVVGREELSDAREGDNKYMAPELLNSVFSVKADVFSLGIAILELASNIELPTSGTSWRLLRVGYIPPECVQVISTDLHRIIQWMLTPNHNERPTIDEILAHSIIVNRRRKLASKMIYDSSTYLFMTVFAVAIHVAFKILAIPFLLLLKPLTGKGGQHHMVGDLSLIQKNENHVKYKWESTDSTDIQHSGSSEKSISSCRGNAAFFTPNVKSGNSSRFSPTPRNSSPVCNRVRSAYSSGSASPDISPLSHNRSFCNRLNSTGKFRSNLDCYFNDFSGHEDSNSFNDSVFASKPRNLLEMLNNVSDSED